MGFQGILDMSSGSHSWLIVKIQKAKMNNDKTKWVIVDNFAFFVNISSINSLIVRWVDWLIDWLIDWLGDIWYAMITFTEFNYCNELLILTSN